MPARKTPKPVYFFGDGKAEGSAEGGSRTGIRVRPLGASQATP